MSGHETRENNTERSSTAVASSFREIIFGFCMEMLGNAIESKKSSSEHLSRDWKIFFFYSSFSLEIYSWNIRESRFSFSFLEIEIFSALFLFYRFIFERITLKKIKIRFSLGLKIFSFRFSFNFV